MRGCAGERLTDQGLRFGLMVASATTKAMIGSSGAIIYRLRVRHKEAATSRVKGTIIRTAGRTAMVTAASLALVPIPIAFSAR